MDQIATLGYVSCTNQIATLGYISCTNHITAFGYHAPITAFGYCFLVNDAMESGGLCTKNDINQKFWAHLMSVMIVAYARASSNEVKIYLNK